MIVRRVFALFAMLLMAHLDIARAYAACAREDTHRAADRAPVTHDHASMDAASMPPQEPSPVSSQAECCRAMASCMVSIAWNDDTASNDFFHEGSAISASVLGAPASLVFAPDPPPPRA